MQSLETYGQKETLETLDKNGYDKKLQNLNMLTSTDCFDQSASDKIAKFLHKQQILAKLTLINVQFLYTVHDDIITKYYSRVQPLELTMSSYKCT